MALEQLQYNIIAILDTETTGLPSTKAITVETMDKWPYIVQFTFIIYDISKNQILEISDDIIHLNDNIDIHEQSIACHGITREISQQSNVYIETPFTKFIQSLEHHKVQCIVGHNISFDIDMVHVEYLRQIQNSSMPEARNNALKVGLNTVLYYPKFCTMKHSIAICKIVTKRKNGSSYHKYPRLGELYQHLFQSSILNLHNSMIDTMATLRCYYQLIYQTDLVELDEEYRTKLNELCVFADPVES